MSYIPSEEALNQYEQPEQEAPSLASKYKDYLQGLGSELLQSGAKGGYNVAMLPSNAYKAATGHPLYSLINPDSTFSQFIPESEAGQTGKDVGDTVSDIASILAPGSVASRGLRALSAYHPFTRGQMRRQFHQPIGAAEQAGIRAPLSYRQLQQLHELLSHPALEQGGSAGRSLTPQGIGALIEGASEGNVPSLHSSQSLMGDLERAIPSRGESYLASTRVRPMKEQLLDSIQRGMREVGMPEEAQNYQNARQASRRYYQTKKIMKKVAKPLSLAALVRAAISGVKNLP